MAQVTTYGETIRPDRGGVLFVSVDSAANDSSKVMVVPEGQTWDIEGIYVQMATSADAGNRQMRVVTSHDGGTTPSGVYNAVATQAASTTEFYNWAPQYNTATETPAGYFCTPLTAHVLPAGAWITVSDVAAVAASADDMTVIVFGHTI